MSIKGRPQLRLEYWKNTIRQFMIFVLVGGGCSVLFFVINYACLRILIIPFGESLLLTYGLCFGVGYTLQRNLTFKSTINHKRSLPKYLALHVGVLTFIYLATPVLSPYFPPSSFGVPLITTFVAGVASFVISIGWVFDTRHQQVVVHDRYN